MRLTLLVLLAAACMAADKRKIYAAGSGQDMLSQPATVREIVRLTEKDGRINVLYLGTASYDNPQNQQRQTQGFIDLNHRVTALAVSANTPPTNVIRDAFRNIDVVIVSGGNTLFAFERWRKLGIDALLRTSLNNGVVLAGGSAGGIVWFDGGHSDSMEPGSYKNPPGPLLNPHMGDEGWANWAYIRVPGLAILSGLFCPHYDMTGSNGVLRSVDMTDLLRFHSGELGIGIDNWAALQIDGDTYTVISRDGQPGSNRNGLFTPDRSGKPAGWRLEIDGRDGSLRRGLIPTTGRVTDLFRPARYIQPSNMLRVAITQNPDDGRPPWWNVTEGNISSSARRFVEQAQA